VLDNCRTDASGVVRLPEDLARVSPLNVGSGYWTSVVASGQTIHLNASKATALSAFQMYEFHGKQQGTMIHPGQTFNLDYSLTQTFPLRQMRLQLGLVGYGQWQTTNKYGPTITSEQSTAYYKVNALGFGAAQPWTQDGLAFILRRRSGVRCS
jgi:hypothetical protein